MADKCHICLLGLIIICSLLTGTSGAEVTHVFSSSGENVRLPCNNALSDCTSTSWIYNRHSEAFELVYGGKKKKDIERRERLGLDSDCSLNIKKFTKEDYGSYTCRQYVNEQQQGADARVYLHVLHVSPSSSQTEIRPGSSVTLFCQLYYDRVSCDTLVRTEGVQLIWVNQAGVNLQTDSRYQISLSGQCISTLTTTLLNEDNNREWRCLVTQRNELKTAVTYTVKYSTTVETQTVTTVTSSKTATTINTPVTSTQPAQDDRTTPVIPTHITFYHPTPNEDPVDTTSETLVCMTYAGLLFRVIVIIVEIAVFAAPTVILLQIICARRDGGRSPNTQKK